MSSLTFTRSPALATITYRLLCLGSRYVFLASSDVASLIVMCVQVSFRNLAKEKLVGKFVNSGSENVVILCHGMLSNKDSCFLPGEDLKLPARRQATGNDA